MPADSAFDEAWDGLEKGFFDSFQAAAENARRRRVERRANASRFTGGDLGRGTETVSPAPTSPGSPPPATSTDVAANIMEALRGTDPFQSINELMSNAQATHREQISPPVEETKIVEPEPNTVEVTNETADYEPVLENDTEEMDPDSLIYQISQREDDTPAKEKEEYRDVENPESSMDILEEPRVDPEEVIPPTMDILDEPDDLSEEQKDAVVEITNSPFSEALGWKDEDGNLTEAGKEIVESIGDQTEEDEDIPIIEEDTPDLDDAKKDEIVANLVDNLGSVDDQDAALANILGLLQPATDPKDDEKTELEEDEIPNILDDPEGKAPDEEQSKDDARSFFGFTGKALSGESGAKEWMRLYDALESEETGDYMTKDFFEVKLEIARHLRNNLDDDLAEAIGSDFEDLSDDLLNLISDYNSTLATMEDLEEYTAEVTGDPNPPTFTEVRDDKLEREKAEAEKAKQMEERLAGVTEETSPHFSNDAQPFDGATMKVLVDMVAKVGKLLDGDDSIQEGNRPRFKRRATIPVNLSLNDDGEIIGAKVMGKGSSLMTILGYTKPDAKNITIGGETLVDVYNQYYKGRKKQNRKIVEQKFPKFISNDPRLLPDFDPEKDYKFQEIGGKGMKDVSILQDQADVMGIDRNKLRGGAFTDDVISELRHRGGGDRFGKKFKGRDFVNQNLKPSPVFASGPNVTVSRQTVDPRDRRMEREMILPRAEGTGLGGRGNPYSMQILPESGVSVTMPELSDGSVYSAVGLPADKFNPKGIIGAMLNHNDTAQKEGHQNKPLNSVKEVEAYFKDLKDKGGAKASRVGNHSIDNKLLQVGLSHHDKGSDREIHYQGFEEGSPTAEGSVKIQSQHGSVPMTTIIAPRTDNLENVPNTFMKSKNDNYSLLPMSMQMKNDSQNNVQNNMSLLPMGWNQ